MKLPQKPDGRKAMIRFVLAMSKVQPSRRTAVESRAKMVKAMASPIATQPKGLKHQPLN